MTMMMIKSLCKSSDVFIIRID